MKNLKKGIMLLAFLLTIFVLMPKTVSAAGKVTISKKQVTVYVGSSTNLKVKGTNKKIAWTTSNPKVATVTAKGKVTGKKKGKAYITAKVSGKKYKCAVTVKNPYLNHTKLKLVERDKCTLNLTGTKVKNFSSNKKSVAIINNKGKITAKKAGKAIISVRGKNGKTYKCTVTVNSKAYLNETKKTLVVGDTYTLKLTGTKAQSFSSSRGFV